MRSGRIFDQNLNVWADCIVLDVSKHGVRVKIKTKMVLSPQLFFFDDRTERMFNAELRWHRDGEVGFYIPEGIE